MKEYKKYKELIDSHILDYLPKVEDEAKTLSQSMEYSLLAGGKRLRPVLLLAACEFTGGDIQDALPYALGLEFIHTYSLIHDDLPAMDNDDLRRGKPTNHKVYGDAMAILAGDGLLNSAYEIMSRDMLLYLDKPEELGKRINAVYSLAKAAGVRGMVAGQVADLESEGKEGDMDMLRFIHINKTTMMIQGSLIAGGYIGGGNPEMIEDLAAYGEYLGLGFQMADDILDVVGSSKELGKNTGADKDLNKMTYIELQGLEKAKEMLHTYTEEGISHLEKYGEAGEFFINLAREMENRTY